MKKHFEYLWYVLRHKYFVFMAGLLIQAPLWQLIMHDMSKFRWSEWKAYVERFYGKYQGNWNMTDEESRGYDTAWLKHQHRNPHHWQYWVLNKDDGAHKPLEMPEKYVMEMIADWAGAGKAITGQWEVAEWFDKNKHKMKFHPKTLDTVLWFVGIMKDKISQ